MHCIWQKSYFTPKKNLRGNTGGPFKNKCLLCKFENAHHFEALPGNQTSWFWQTDKWGCHWEPTGGDDQVKSVRTSFVFRWLLVFRPRGWKRKGQHESPRRRCCSYRLKPRQNADVLDRRCSSGLVTTGSHSVVGDGRDCQDSLCEDSVSLDDDSTSGFSESSRFCNFRCADNEGKRGVILVTSSSITSSLSCDVTFSRGDVLLTGNAPPPFAILALFCILT